MAVIVDGLVESWTRMVRCYCGAREVATRRPEAMDKMAICSKACMEQRDQETKAKEK